MRADHGLNDRWADLYAVVAPAALGFAYGLCSGDHAGAEDLFHDAFLRCVKRRGATKDHDGFVQYLRRAMVNASIDRSRRDQTRRRWLARQQGQAAMEDSQSVFAERDVLLRALRHLPARQRAAVVARTFLDLSEAETAQVLDCSVGNVKSLTSRGLAALRSQFDQQEARDG
jgi:RNA polymerase sigma-70 factor (sigma-E family)